MRSELIQQAAQTIADQVIGTANPPDVRVIENVCEELALTAEEAKSMQFAAACDELYFCCDGCGWYCSTEELNNDTDENLCDDCNDE